QAAAGVDDLAVRGSEHRLAQRAVDPQADAAGRLAHLATDTAAFHGPGPRGRGRQRSRRARRRGSGARARPGGRGAHDLSALGRAQDEALADIDAVVAADAVPARDVTVVEVVAPADGIERVAGPHRVGGGWRRLAR